MKIKAIKINNFLGVKEFNYTPTGINVFEGAKGAGKSSILEGIETALTNIKRRTEVIKHGEEEATLFIELDNGLEISRKVRNEKSDYFKLSRDGKAVKSTEGELRKLLSGDIFRPLDFIGMKAQEQTAIILNMIEMNYTIDDLESWFGPLHSTCIDTSKHLLQTLKAIETNLYDERQEVNRNVITLKNQVKGIEQTLPPNYKGVEWKDIALKTYYDKISAAQKVNGFIVEANNLKDSIALNLSNIEAVAANDISKIKLESTENKQIIKDAIRLRTNEIDNFNSVIASVPGKRNDIETNINNELNLEIAKMKEKYELLKRDKLKAIDDLVTRTKEDIVTLQIDISKQNSKLLSLEEIEKSDINHIISSKADKITQEELRVEKASKYLLEHEVVDVSPIEAEIETITTMQSFLREWERAESIKNNTLKGEITRSEELTLLIDIARTKPGELLQAYKLPIDGISVDENSLIRINGTLLDGLSDGEKLEAAFKIALQRIGELRIMCLDGFEKLNLTEQKKVVELCENNDIQAFITITTENEEVTIKSAL